MPQSDGSHKLKRIALRVGSGGKGWYRFQVNPENYKHTKPQRVTIFKTKSQIITEDFGKDIETIQFSGTTGFRKDAQGRTGKDRLEELSTYIDDYASQGGNGNRSKQELTFFNFTDDVYYVVHLAPEGLSIDRNAEQPLLFTYTLSLVVLRDAGAPPERDQANPDIGNAKPSVGGSGASSGIGNAGQLAGSGLTRSAVNPQTTKGAYEYGVNELKEKIGYGG